MASTFAIINCKTGKHLSISNGSVVTTPETSIDKFHNHWALEDSTDAGEAEKTLHVIRNTASGDVLEHSDGKSIQLRSDAAMEPTLQWKMIPNETDAEIFYIANAQSETCLKDMECGTATAAISTDIIPTNSAEHESPLLWKVVALMAKLNITPIRDPMVNYADRAMRVLIEQWPHDKIDTGGKNVTTMLSIDENDMREHDLDPRVIHTKDAVRIDRQGFLEEKKFANIQGQVDGYSVLNVIIQTQVKWGARNIQESLEESLDGAKKVRMAK